MKKLHLAAALLFTLFSSSFSSHAGLPPNLDLDSNDSTTTGNDFLTTFFTGNGGILIRDVDAVITDPDSTSMDGATVTLTNPQPGDELTVVSTPAGITVIGEGTTTLTFSGLATIEDYQWAISWVRFNNTQPVPSSVQRLISVVVTDDTGEPAVTPAVARVDIYQTIVVDLDADDSSGATGTDYNTRYNVGVGPAVALADTDVFQQAGGTLSEVRIYLDPKPADVLEVEGTLPTGCTATFSSDGREVLLQGCPSQPDWMTALQQFRFRNPSPIPDMGLRTFFLSFRDDNGYIGNTNIVNIGMGTDFAVSFDAIPQIVLTADDLRYTITVTNLNPALATDVVLTDTLPEGMLLTGASGEGWDCNEFQAGGSSTVLCTLPALASGNSATVELDVVTPVASDTLVNTVVVRNSDPGFGTGGGVQETLAVDFDAHGFADPQEVDLQLDVPDDLTVPAPVVFGEGDSMDILLIGDPDPGGGSVRVAREFYDGADETYWASAEEINREGGAQAGDGFGHALALDDVWMVVGAPGVGEAWVYQGDLLAPFYYSPGINPPPQQLLPLTTPGVGYGTAVAIDGDTLVVGSPDEGSRGMVHVFTRSGSTWSAVQVIDAAGLQDSSGTGIDTWRFGETLALQNGTLVIGAPSDGNATVPGRAFIYTHGQGTWSFTVELANPDADFMDRFGWSLALDGDTLALGSIFNPAGGLDSGAAHVYTRDIDGYWSHLQRLANPEPLGFEEFSASLSLQGDTLVAGTPYARTLTTGGEPSGATYVFQRSGGVFGLQQKVADQIGLVDAEFARGVVLFGNRLAATRSGVAAAPDNGLVVFTLEVDAPGIKLTAPSPVAGAHFGHAVDISGDTVVIGAPDDVNGLGQTDGAVFVYQRDATGNWPLQQKLERSLMPSWPSRFGAAVAIDGDTLVVGAPDENFGEFFVYGAAHVFTRSYPGTWTLAQTLDAGVGYRVHGDKFGSAVGVDGYFIAVGAPGDEAASPPDRGAVYPFRYIGTWVNEGDGFNNYLVGSWGGAFANLGASVAVSGDTLVASAPGASGVFVFTNAGGYWVEQQGISVTSPDGLAVAIDGDRLAIGDPDAPLGYGQVHTWLRSGGTWTQESQLVSNFDGLIPSDLGTSVALLGDVLLASDTGADGLETASGVALQWWSNGGVNQWFDRPTLQAADGETGDAFGGGVNGVASKSHHSVALSRDAQVVGAPLEDGASISYDYGAAYVYFTGTHVSSPGGEFGADQVVTLGCVDCDTTYYTVDGSPVVEADGVTPTASAQVYSVPLEITANTTLNLFSVDALGNAETAQSMVFNVDKTAPSVGITPFSNGEVTVSPLLQAPVSGTATDNAGGTGVSLVQVEIRDVSMLEYIQSTDGSEPGRGSAQKWLTATGTDNWSLPFTGTVHPFEEGHSYMVRVRSFDAVGNPSVIETASFGYFTLPKAFMTLDLNLSASSILNVPGDNSEGDGEIGASVKLTDPGDLNADLSNSAITLMFTDPNAVETNIPLTTNSNGQETIQDLGDGTLIDFTVEGTWTVEAHFAGTLTRDPASSAPLTLLVGQSAGSAVIVVGRLGGTNEGLESHNKTGKRIYDTLIKRGFQPQDIEFYSPDTNRDGIIDGLDGADCEDGDGCNDYDDSLPNGIHDGLPNGIDGVPTLVAVPTITGHKNVQAAIEGMAALSNSNPAPRYAFMVDHGNVNEFLLNDLNGGEVITPANLDDWLDSQELLLTGDALIKPNVVVLGMCYAGSFLDTVAVDNFFNPSPSSRVVMATATDLEESYKGTKESDGIRVGEFQLEEFVKEAGRGANLKAAFEYATGQTEIFTRKGDLTSPDAVFNDVAAQHPLLEDNRSYSVAEHAQNNALDDAPGSDGELASTLYLGVGPTYATNAVSNPADIVSVTDTVFLPVGLDVSPLTLTAYDDTKVASAWVEIRAPATQYLPSGDPNNSIQLDPILTKSLMNPPVSPQSAPPLNSWYTYYTNFSLEGKYEVFYFVQDATTDEISPIKRSVVYRNYAGNTPPSAFNLDSPVDGATVATIGMFDWDNSSDGDGVTYTLQIDEVDDPVGNPGVCAFTSLAHTQEELTVSHAYVGQGDGLQDDTDYCWRVLAVDGYGATTISTPASRTFHTDDGNGYLGFVSGTVRDSVSGVGLDGAVVTPSGGTVVDYSEHNGSYLIAVDPADTYTFTASVAGYADGNHNAAATRTENEGEDILLTSNTLDTDGDGIPDVTDPDDDNDGISDVDEIAAGSDPRDDTSWPHYADGDLNADGEVNAGDYVIAMRISLGLETATPVHLAHGDMAPATPDGEITTPDVLLVLRVVMGL